MQETQPAATSEILDAREVLSQLRRINVFANLREEDASCLGSVEVRHIPAGASPYKDGDILSGFWGVVEGEIRGTKKEADGSSGFEIHLRSGDSFGEVPLLTGRRNVIGPSSVLSDSILIGVGEDGFWRLMSTCSTVRRAVLANMEHRLESYQAFALHREKLMSLGTLAAGLMHELNNPGTAARRAAAQLRENLIRLQQISLRLCETPLGGEQLECMKGLQERALSGEKAKPMSAMDQSDAEECLADWLDEKGVENSWKISPTLTAIGITEQELDCTEQSFPAGTFSDALNWLVSLVSSMQLVETVEESITRVSDLVMAVKKYSYNEAGGQCKLLDIHDGLRSTLTILGHKLRPKDLKIDKQFASDLPVMESRGAGLTQVWTNLLDNAVDASPSGGTIHIRTWTENGMIGVGIADEGAGIPDEHRDHIFDAFFTTKAVGVGTGLGLEIAKRIVGSYGGEISFTSEPGHTEFVVLIPVAAPAGTALPQS